MIHAIITHLAAVSFGTCMGVVVFAILRMARDD